MNSKGSVDFTFSDTIAGYVTGFDSVGKWYTVKTSDGMSGFGAQFCFQWADEFLEEIEKLPDLPRSTAGQSVFPSAPAKLEKNGKTEQ